MTTADEEARVRSVPTPEVMHEATGTGAAELPCLTRRESRRTAVEKRVTLPWRRSVRVPRRITIG
ncbi:hypothetical protein ACFU8W_03195 [Streptomyces sp. NPDC057565]|uniref:hypothetical protein n=1 Tax=Streptomyces sp. NPDC057565 TaxID=3346169 RepID=UPI0036C82522